MLYKKNKKGTVLVYTMVLVVLGVFMATVVLNVAIELSVEYDKRNIEISLIDIIKTKGDLSMKYSRELNQTGGGFIDDISCPENISMSGSTILDSDIDTQIRYLTGSIVCLGTHDNGSSLQFIFNEYFNDLLSAQYQGHQISINSGSTSGTFGDSDSTFLDLGGASYLTSDGIDDNFDSDNFNSLSIDAIYYPDDYTDNDSDARTINYGYVIEGESLYNTFWSNSKMKNYIQQNPYNNDTLHVKLGQVSSGYLSLDINTSHKLILYKIDNDIYNDSNELIIEETITGDTQLGGVGYLQDDLTLDSSTGSAYNFDFINNDYALFVENTSSGVLLYQIEGEETTTEKPIYLNPLKDNDISIFSYLGSHMLVNEEGQLIGDQFEVFGLKNTQANLPDGMNMWLDAADVNTISTDSGIVTEWRDKSGNGNKVSQSTVSYRPTSGVSELNGLNTITFTEDYVTLDSEQNFRTLFFVVQNANGSNRAANVSPIVSENDGSNSSYTFINTNVSSSSYDISVDGSVSDWGSAYYAGASYVQSGTNIDLGLSITQVTSPAIWVNVQKFSTPFQIIGGLDNGLMYRGILDIAEIISYDRVLTSSEMNQVGNYLSNKWGLTWLDF